MEISNKRGLTVVVAMTLSRQPALWLSKWRKFKQALLHLRFGSETTWRTSTRCSSGSSGFGFRLAMSNVGWHTTQKFVILVPDPIGFAPWPVHLLRLYRLSAMSGRHQWLKHVISKIWIESTVSRWSSSGQYSQDSLHFGILEEIQKMMTESRCEPEQFKGRIIFMSMYNDIDWTKRGNKGICVANALEITEYALFSFRPISYHKSIGGRSSSRWSAGRATSSRRRGAGRSWRVAAASRRSGRNARSAGSGVARFVHVLDLARQSRAMVFAWWNRCIIRPCCAADGGAGGELRGRASLAAVSFSRHIRLASYVLLCRAADVLRSGPAPGRRAHEAV